jgi:SAM-dependent methyltransferase
MVSAQAGGKSVPDASAADVELADTLETLEDTENYTSWILELVEPHLGSKLLEVGAGHGTITGHLADGGRQVTATDVSERCVGILQDRFAGQPNVRVLVGSIEVAGAGATYDTAVLINVLEHIEDDRQALHQLVGLLEPGGRLVLWLPAFDFLYSEFDRKIGHYRRYRVGDIRQKLSEAGLQPTDIRYVNPVGAVGWFVIAKVLRRDPVSGPLTRLFDRCLVPLLKLVENHVRPPFGQSVFAVGVRKTLP